MKKFEEMMQSMAKMSPAEREESTKKLATECICPSCLSYTRCAKDAHEMMFCANGKSFMCIPSEKGCVCPNCPVTSELGLKNTSFCTRGSEKAQRYEHALWGTKII